MDGDIVRKERWQTTEWKERYSDMGYDDAITTKHKYHYLGMNTRTYIQIDRQTRVINHQKAVETLSELGLSR